MGREDDGVEIGERRGVKVRGVGEHPKVSEEYPAVSIFRLHGTNPRIPLPRRRRRC